MRNFLKGHFYWRRELKWWKNRYNNTWGFCFSRDASKRTRGERHFDVQIMGGLVLHKGNIAEMKTEKVKL